MRIFLPLVFCLFGSSVCDVPDDGRQTNHKSDPRYNRDLEYGDFLLTPEQKDLFQGRSSINFTKWPSYQWPGGKIPYVVNTSQFSAATVSSIHNSMKECNRMAGGCINFVNRTNERDYVSVVHKNGCWSYVGRIGGPQEMSLQHPGCTSTGTICHECMHALGFTHEHNREDRDSYIRMRWENINPGWESQFQKVYASDYMMHNKMDCCSIMMYPRYHPDLCKPGTNAWDPMQPMNCSEVVGYATKLSDTDRDNLCKAYGKK